MKGLLGLWMSGSFRRAFIVASLGREVTQGAVADDTRRRFLVFGPIVEIAFRVGIIATVSSRR